MTPMKIEDNFPITIYKENSKTVTADLNKGSIDYLDLTSWSFADKFFAFLFGIKFFHICGASYPSPRIKEEVALWFLIICQIQLKLHKTASYHKLPGILKNGAVLAKVKFNIGGIEGGFNRKNRKPRKIPTDQDTVRKLFKDSNPYEMNAWYNNDVIKFFRTQRSFDKHGIFVLDQSHVVVPDNTNYKDADWMAVDEHGQRINTKELTDEQKKAIKYRLCYSLSALLHIGKDDNSHIIAGYKFGNGKADELKQGREIVRDFTKAIGKGVMRLLIMDRGYIDHQFIKEIKTEHGADVLIPLKSNMEALDEAIRIAENYKRNEWKAYNKYVKNDVTFKEEIVSVEDINLWKSFDLKLYVSLMKITGSDGSVRYWGLCSTFRPKTVQEPFDFYKLRTKIEERYKQIKNDWRINKFTSPNRSLVEAHVMFTLLTYSLIQLYLNKKHLTELANKTISTIAAQEKMGLNSVIVYSKNNFTVYNLDHYSDILINLEESARLKLKAWLDTRKIRAG